MEEDAQTFTAMTEAGFRLFEATGFDTKCLAALLKSLYEENPYSLYLSMLDATGAYK